MQLLVSTLSQLLNTLLVCLQPKGSSTVYSPKAGVCRNMVSSALVWAFMGKGLNDREMEVQVSSTVRWAVPSAGCWWLLSGLKCTCKNDADVLLPPGLPSTSLQSKNILAKQSQGSDRETDEWCQCAGARDFCLSFPFLLHFSNLLDVKSLTGLKWLYLLHLPF